MPVHNFREGWTGGKVMVTIRSWDGMRLGADCSISIASSLNLAKVYKMKADEIRKLLHNRPFLPFYIHVADSGRLLVKHEDFVALAPSGREMIVYRHDRPDDYQVVDVMLVTRLEVVSRNGAKKSG